MLNVQTYFPFRAIAIYIIHRRRILLNLPSLHQTHYVHKDNPRMRRSGILLHPTSLPGGRGCIGSIGSTARDFIRFLAQAGQTVWQVLPLVPTDDSGCPYNSTSAMAYNTRLVDLDDLTGDDFACLLSYNDFLDEPEPERRDRVEFATARQFKDAKLRIALSRLKTSNHFNADAVRSEFADFCAKNAAWLDDFTLFDTLQNVRPEGPLWSNWPKALRDREPSALAAARVEFKDEIELRKFGQFVFYKQWMKLRSVASQYNIKIMGDVPIFVSYNSVDVWANRKYFQLNAEGKSESVAGVPPDCFAKEGQLWGNPLYDWKVLAESGYDWWLKRLGALATLVAIVRIDHFRGFAAFWSVAATEKTAINGHWVKGPGLDFFKAVAKAYPNLEIIAEDLGIITPDVEKLRKDAGFPGMRVLQFGFPLDNANDHHALHMHTQDSVVYCGTHDNATTIGWYTSLDEAQRDRVRRYLAIDGNEIAWQLMTAALSSVADLCILTVQDIFSFGTDARMNVPGIAKGNWAWRMLYNVAPWSTTRLRGLVELYGRAPEQQGDKNTASYDSLS